MLALKDQHDFSLSDPISLTSILQLYAMAKALNKLAGLNRFNKS